MRLCVLLGLLCLLALTQAAHVFEAHRVIQFDRGGTQLGSRRALVNHRAAAPAFEEAEYEEPSIPAAELVLPEEAEGEDDEEEVLPPVQFGSSGDRAAREAAREAAAAAAKAASSESASASGSSSSSSKSLSRRAAVVRLSELTPGRLVDIAERRAAAAVLILIPAQEALANASSADLEEWNRVERLLMSRKFDLPIYMAYEDAALLKALEELKETEGSNAERMRLVGSAAEATALPTVTVHNWQGIINSPAALTAAGDLDSVPTIGIVASYDSFGAAPGLSFGVDDNGSGTIALLELMRIFSRLHADARTQGQYNLLFLLTAGGRQNYAGAKHWLKAVDARVLESLDFVLCLDTIGSGDQLYLHVSKKPKTDDLKALYNSFKVSAESLSVPLEILPRRLNMTSPYMNWQHEQFAKKRKNLVAATLSSKRHPTPLYFASSVLDVKTRVNAETLARNIRIIAEALSKQIYGKAGERFSMIKGSNAVNTNFVQAWLDFLGSQSRVSGYSPSGKAEVATELDRHMAQFASEHRKTAFALESGFKFYKQEPVQLSLYRVKPLSFDILLCLGVLSYLGLLHFGLRKALGRKL